MAWLEGGSLKRLPAFSYLAPGTLAEALELLSQQARGAYPLAGGTDLVVRMKRGEIAPLVVVNLKRIPGLSGIVHENGSGVRIGALASIADIECSPLIRSRHPLLSEAAAVLGAPSIRNLATLGGNIARASPASDMAPSLIVLKARIRIAGPRGNRDLDPESFFSGPGATAMQPGEIITSFFVPHAAARSGAAYLKFGRSGGMDCALASVAVAITLGKTDTRVEDVAVAIGACSAVPMRARTAEEIIRSGSLSERHIQEAGSAAAAEASPISDLRARESYRRQLVKVLFSRALLIAWNRAKARRDAL